MARIPTTSTTLLRDLAQDSQHARWGEFVARYRPMMEAYLRERFPRVDVDDAVQETLIALIKSMPVYPPQGASSGPQRPAADEDFRNAA